MEDGAAAEDEEDEDVERIANVTHKLVAQLSQEKGKYVTRMTEFSSHLNQLMFRI